MPIDNWYSDQVIAAAPSEYMSQGLVPLCFARPENSGSVNGEPFKISLEGTGMSATIVGGNGVCLWADPGRQRIKITWSRGGGVLVDTVVFVPKPRGLKMNICVVIPKTRPPVQVGWALRREGAKCLGNYLE